MSLFRCDPHHIPASLDPHVDPGLRNEYVRNEARRQFFCQVGRGLGVAALSSLMGKSLMGAVAQAQSEGMLPGGFSQIPHIAPRAKRAIFLVMAGGPSQLDTWDHKPDLQFDMDMPLSVLGGGFELRMGMASTQARFPIQPSIFKFHQHGKAHTWVSDLLPYTAKVVDELAVINSMHGDSVNHDPALTAMLTGNTQQGKPSMGAWISYGLGSMNENLPTYMVLTSKWVDNPSEAIFSRLWGSAFLPPSYGGVSFRTDGGDPVLYINDQAGMDRVQKRLLLDGVQELNRATYEELGDPQTHARIEEYEMAFRMQSSVPELTDLSRESAETFELYGPRSREPGTFAYNCLLARRMAERGVRFTQIFHRGWDHHGKLPEKLPKFCLDTDQPCYALITDLKRRGLLDDTLIIWGGEFGRTPYSEGKASTRESYGRDHHPKVFTMWVAGGGIKPGIVYGQSDEFSYKPVRDPVHVRDFHATILHQLGLDHNRLTFRFQGLDQKLTGTTPANVVRGLIS